MRSYNGGGYARPLKTCLDFSSAQYIQKGKKWRKVFIYKNPDTLQKARQFVLRFLYKNPDTLSSAIFHDFFEIGIRIQKEW